MKKACVLGTTSRWQSRGKTSGVLTAMRGQKLAKLVLEASSVSIILCIPSPDGARTTYCKYVVLAHV